MSLTFAELSQHLQQMEQTSSRLELIHQLAYVFQHLATDEIDKLIYLLQGRVAPMFKPIEIGMADKMVAQSIAEAFGIPREQVIKRYEETGDLGTVAYILSTQQQKGSNGAPGDRSADLSITDVFTTLLTIAHTSGAGAMGQKVNLLQQLLSHMGPLSAKYAVRMTLGDLRLGLGDQTILEAAAQAWLGSRSHKATLQAAYNRTSDLGLVVRTLAEGGIEAVEQLQIRLGNPLRPQLAERLPSPEAVITKLGEVIIQDKYDGIRVQIHKDGTNIRIFSRRLEDMTAMFPEIVEGTCRQLMAQTAILDGEAVAYNPLSGEFVPFQETARRRRQHDIEEMAKRLPLSVFVFDLLYQDGQPLIEKPLRERLRLLEQTLHGDSILFVAQNQTTRDATVLATALQDAISRGLEGLVAKRPNTPYEAGARNFNWVKLKRHSAGALNDTIDCVLLGYFVGRGKRAELGAGALLVGVYDDERDEFVTVSKIGTGLSDEGWREVYRRAEQLKVDHKPARVRSLIEPTVWVEPAIVIEVLADEITRSPLHTAGKQGNEPGYALRFPRFISFRGEDKRPEDATTVRELIEMYKQQERRAVKE
jgi:DNA ligase-1